MEGTLILKHYPSNQPCTGTHQLQEACLTFPGRFRVLCSDLSQPVCASKEEVVASSDEEGAWIQGFLHANLVYPRSISERRIWRRRRSFFLRTGRWPVSTYRRHTYSTNSRMAQKRLMIAWDAEYARRHLDSSPLASVEADGTELALLGSACAHPGVLAVWIWNTRELAALSLDKATPEDVLGAAWLAGYREGSVPLAPEQPEEEHDWRSNADSFLRSGRWRPKSFYFWESL